MFRPCSTPLLGLGLCVGLAAGCGAPEATPEMTAEDSEDSQGSEDSGEMKMDFLGEECDPWAPDCPEGQKCGPISIEPYGHVFDHHRCVPLVTESARVGLDEVCNSWGLQPENYDNCVEGQLCWGAKDVVPLDMGGAANDLEPDDLRGGYEPTLPAHGTEEGLCRRLCEGTEDNPDCGDDKWSWCVHNNGASICVDTCNPLDMNCDEAHNCMWDEVKETLNCIHMSPERREIGEDCSSQFGGTYGIVCERGLHCDPGAWVPGCETEYCCNDWCATDGSVECHYPEQECVPFWPENDAPPGQELLGSCQIPTMP